MAFPTGPFPQLDTTNRAVAGYGFNSATGLWEPIGSTGNALWVYPASIWPAEDTLTASLKIIQGGLQYETVAAGASNQVMGTTGAVGDYLNKLICVVSAAATSQVQIKDGSDTAITVLPNAVGPGISTYVIEIGLKSRTGAWQVTTAAGVAVIAGGVFT